MGSSSHVMGKPALRSVQEGVEKRREAPDIFENSGVGDIQANVTDERAVIGRWHGWRSMLWASLPSMKWEPLFQDGGGGSQSAPASPPSSSSHPGGVSVGETSADKTWTGMRARGVGSSSDPRAPFPERSDHGHLPSARPTRAGVGENGMNSEQPGESASTSTLVESSTRW